TFTSISNLKAKFWAFMENNQVSYIKLRTNRDPRRLLKEPHYMTDPSKMLTKYQCHNTGTHITVPTEQLQARPEANTTPTIMINNNLPGKDTIQLNVNMVEDIKQLI
ncbi:13695_t:CDS:2, partial [Acaulospora morrowiae]